MLGENEYILGKVPQNLRVEGLCSLVWTQAARCGGSTDIVVKQTGQGEKAVCIQSKFRLKFRSKMSNIRI